MKELIKWKEYAKNYHQGSKRRTGKYTAIPNDSKLLGKIDETIELQIMNFLKRFLTTRISVNHWNKLQEYYKYNLWVSKLVALEYLDQYSIALGAIFYCFSF
ncbi:hypothetical protein Scep_007394 [Stephania cephalantha]|uniref:Uncharacterized protein n=1 Tax=Stephania cephalantha TaxID=152367 RepID=A0AAP0KCH0_9MAGN